MEDKRRKLSDEQKSEIKTRYEAGGVTFSALAEEYGVSKSTIYHAVAGPRVIKRQNLPGLLDRRRKLTDDQILLIKEKYAKGNTTYRKLAAEFGVTYSEIYLILKAGRREYVNAYNRDYMKTYRTKEENKEKIYEAQKKTYEYRKQLKEKGLLED